MDKPTTTRKLASDKGKSVKVDVPAELTDSDEDESYKVKSIKNRHDPRRARDIIIEKRKALEISSVAEKKEKKHRHKKSKRATEQSQELPPRQPENTKELKANTETQMIVLRKFKEMTNPEYSYNTHLRVLRSWFDLLYGSDSLPSMAFLSLDGNAVHREVVVPAANAPK